MTPKMLTMKDVATLLNVTRQYVSQLTQDGVLPCNVFGKRAIRYREDDILEYLEKTHRPAKKKDDEDETNNDE